jgi:hypothetical protein
MVNEDLFWDIDGCHKKHNLHFKTEKLEILAISFMGTTVQNVCQL